MEFPKLRKPRAGLKLGYSQAYVTRYAKLCAIKALEQNSVDWQNLTKEEIIKLIPKGADEKTFVEFAKVINDRLMKVNTWHL